MSDELKPCPFCGGPGYLCQIPSASGGDRYIWIAKCSAEEGCGVEFLGTSRKVDAIKEWNTRVDPSPKWTYCEDALPEDENDYVATVFDQYHQSFFVHWSMFRDGVWDIEGEDLNWKVIAWQPLPAPAEPKENK